MQLFHHMLCMISFPITTQWTIIESISIRVYQYTFCLPVNKSGYQKLQIPIVFHQRQIRPHLRGRITQPHSVNVTSYDKRIRTVVFHLISDSSIKCIGKTIFKHPPQFFIFYLWLYFFNDYLYSS